jgi:hypothetical protein
MNTIEGMDIITKDDLNNIIDEYDNVIYDTVRDNKDTSFLSDSIYVEIVDKYELVDK